MTEDDLDLIGADTEVISDQLADGDVGLAIDWSGHHPDHESTIRAFRDLIASGARDDPYLQALGVLTHDT